MELTYLYVVTGIALFYVLVAYIQMKRKSPGSPEMIEISDSIAVGAMAFLKREYSILFLVVAAISGILYFAIGHNIVIAFLMGAFCSATAGFIGMRVATIANVRTANAARSSLNDALKIAFSSGTILGISVVALGFFGVVLLYHIFHEDSQVIFGLSLGASLVALFARVGGGIFTKAADVGADLVGKVERNIPEDDPRNPAVIADNVGDNVGDVAGMGADLFESYVGSLIAAITLGAISYGSAGVLYPFLLAGVGIIASIISVFFVNVSEGTNVHTALRKPLYICTAIVVITAGIGSWSLFGGLGMLYATVSGLVAGIFIGLITEYYTSGDYGPVKEIARSAQTSAATNIIEGFSTGLASTALPILVLAGAIFVAHYFAGLYGVAISAVGMLSTLGISLAVDAYGPVADNAGGIAEMTGQNPEVRKRTDILDSVGNTTAAMGKGFAIGSAALTALALFSTFIKEAHLSAINLANAKVVMGLLIGGMLPFLFCSLTMRAVGRSAFDMIEEVRRQFRENAGILAATSKPDYARCVDISTTSALKKMLVPGFLAIVSPVTIGAILGLEALGGFLAGSLTTGVLLAISMANSGGAWDNAKKHIEAGEYGGKGSEAHKAAVIGDTVGDPMKDTSGPSLNILIKLMSIVALIFLAVVSR